MSNLVECATCGYPLTPEERTTLVEVNGKMRKPWVGLTKEEVEDIEITWEATSEWSTFGHAVRYIEAKLKEKNA